MRTPARVTFGIGVITLGVIGLAANLAISRTKSKSAPTAAKPERVAAVLPSCGDYREAGSGGAPYADNLQARAAAQRGLDFLGKEASAWTKTHDCYGCHVQAVTLEAMSVGKHHQYRIDDTQLKTVLHGMLDVKGGARRQHGLGYEGSPDIAETAKVLGVAAFARYDQWVASDLRDYLIADAKALLSRQTTSGEVPLPYVRPPVATGPIQGTAQAIITWKQAFERSADDRWLTAIQKGEQYLRSQVQTTSDTQILSYLAIGLYAAGVSPSEDILVGIRKKLLDQQATDGSWSSPLLTGQALYTLRLLGMTDHDTAIARGTEWLIAKQQQDGGWSGEGFGKAEAMWAVLGLVSIDVLTVAIDGVKDGQRVAGTLALKVEARDNKGGGVQRVELHLDDLPLHGACGSTTTFTLDAATLETGRHTLDVVARNTKGEVSRRRLELYAGDVFLAQIGTSWSNGETEVSLRDLDDTGAHEVSFEVVRDGKVIHTAQQKGQQGPLRFGFKGDAGRYEARLSYRDATGKVRQTEAVPFVHDTPAQQEANYAQVGGSLELEDGASAANAPVELVDENGNVVAKTVSTKEGKYRFKNVEADKQYSVRISKKGFAAAKPAAQFKAEKGKEQAADVMLKKK